MSVFQKWVDHRKPPELLENFLNATALDVIVCRVSQYSTKILPLSRSADFKISLIIDREELTFSLFILRNCKNKAFNF